MNNPIKGADGPGSPRYPTQTEGAGKADPKEVLSRLSAGGPDPALRQGEGREPPLDGGKTRRRMEDARDALSSLKGQGAAPDLAGLLSTLGGATRDTASPRDALRGQIAAFGRDPATFLRGENAFSSQLRDDLMARLGPDGLAGLFAPLQTEPPPPDLNAGLAAMGEAGAAFTARSLAGLLDAVLGDGGGTGLPEDWHEPLRRAAQDIAQSGLDPAQRADATRALVKSAVFLRFLCPELAKATLGSGATPDLAPLAPALLHLVSGGAPEALSPALRQALAPLAQDLGPRLDRFIGGLGIDGFGG